MVNPADMVAAIDAALAENPIGAAEVRYSDGRVVKYSSRKDLINEREYWQRMVDAQTGSGLQMTRLGLLGDA